MTTREKLTDAKLEKANDEANEFAAHLLIPEQFLAPLIEKRGRVDIDDEKWIDDLAKKFRVTRGLMIFRLLLRERPAGRAALQEAQK